MEPPRAPKLYGRRFVPVSSDKEVRDMPITITFHIFGFTVTVRIKGRNRHSAK